MGWITSVPAPDERTGRSQTCGKVHETIDLAIASLHHVAWDIDPTSVVAAKWGEGCTSSTEYEIPRHQKEDAPKPMY